VEDLSVPAQVQGRIDPAGQKRVEFREQKSGATINAADISSDGEFSIRVPEGRYDVQHGSAHTSLTVLPGGIYSLDLRAEHVLDFKVSSQDARNGEIVLQVSATGAGDHTFAIRTDNLSLSQLSVQGVHLTSGTSNEIIWHARVISPETPWVAVIVPDGDLSRRTELNGVNGASK
jgi:hypothetical protein